MAAAHIQNGVYFIQNRGTGTVVDLANGSSVEGTKVQGYKKRELTDTWVPAQLWVIAETSPGSNLYTIENTNGRTSLELRSNANGAPIAGYNRSTSDNQKWLIVRGDNATSYVIANKATGTYFDLYNGNPANLTPVQGWTGSGHATTNDHQLWNFVRA